MAKNNKMSWVYKRLAVLMKQGKTRKESFKIALSEYDKGRK